MGVVETHFLHEYLNTSCAGICPGLVTLYLKSSAIQMVLSLLYSLHTPRSLPLLLRLQTTARLVKNFTHLLHVVHPSKCSSPFMLALQAVVRHKQDNRIIQRLRLEQTLKIIQFQTPCRGLGCHPQIQLLPSATDQILKQKLHPCFKHQLCTL